MTDKAFLLLRNPISLFFKPLILGTFAFYFFILPLVSLNAWWGQAHMTIAANAIEILPDGLRRALESNQGIIQAGAVEPDYSNAHDHMLLIQGSGGLADGALEKFSLTAEKMIKSGEPMDKIAFVLGQAAHFIQDLNVPLHTVHSSKHRDYETVAFLHGWGAQNHYYSGFYLIENYRCFAYETAKRSNQYASLANQYPPPPHVIEITWLDAINDVANLWQSIFYRALGPEKALEVYGIPKPKGEKGKGLFCW
jgi:hypothetical protein